jgi:hypothetical protein
LLCRGHLARVLLYRGRLACVSGRHKSPLFFAQLLIWLLVNFQALPTLLGKLRKSTENLRAVWIAVLRAVLIAN